MVSMLDTPVHVYIDTCRGQAHVDNDREGPVVHGLGAVGPEVGALSEVHHTGTQTAAQGNRQTEAFRHTDTCIGTCIPGANESSIRLRAAHKLLVYIAGAYELPNRLRAAHKLLV